jgi:hypothetical protein
MTTHQATPTTTSRCQTCFGTGEVGGPHGVVACPDCFGLGTLPSSMVLVERRLRDLESRYAAAGSQAALDVRWLVDEVRRSRHALVQILAAGADAQGASDADRALSSKMLFLANDVLDYFQVEAGETPRA